VSFGLFNDAVIMRRLDEEVRPPIARGATFDGPAGDDCKQALAALNAMLDEYDRERAEAAQADIDDMEAGDGK